MNVNEGFKTRLFCFFSIVVFFIGGKLFSQNSPIDSLQNILQSSKEDTSKVNLLDALSNKYMDVGSYDTALTYANQQLELSEKLSFLKGNIQSLTNIGYIYIYKNDYPKSLEYFFKSLKLAEKNNYKTIMASNYGSIGNIIFEQKEYSKSLMYYEKAIKIFEEIGDKSGIANSLGSIGNVYLFEKKYEKALEYFFKVVALYENQNNETKIAALGNIALIYSYKGDLDKALEYNFKTLEIANQIGNKIIIGINQSNIGDIYVSLKKYKEAEEYLKMALNTAYEIKDLKGIMQRANSLSDLYALQNNWQLSLEYYKMHITYKDSIFNETKSEQIAEMQTKYEVEKKDNDLLLLNAEKTTAENKKYFFIATSILLLLLILVIINRQKKQKEANDIKQQLIQSELDKSKLEAEKLESELIKNQEKLNNYTKLITEKTELLDKMQQQLQDTTDVKLEEKNIKNLLKTIEEYIDPNEYWEEFITTFNLVHKNFFDKLSKEYPDLTRTELRLCALIKCNLGNKEIANVLAISPNTIKTACNRLGKKMKLKEDENLRQFILKAN